jgi:carbonic anhydrase
MYKMLCVFFTILLSASLSAEQEGLKRLLQGNERYVQDKLEHPNRSLERRQAIASKQEPFATIVGCADSRVSPEIVFDQGVGDLFVVRVAGNVIGPLELDSIEYSIIHLHASVIVVLGHENCGAVDAVIKGTVQDIESVAELIQPAVQVAREKNPHNLLEASIKANALRMKDFLLKTSVIQKYVSDKKLEVYAGYYNLQTGAVELLK